MADVSAGSLLYANSDLQTETYSSITHLFNSCKPSEEHSFFSDQKHKLLCFKKMLSFLLETHLSIPEYRSQGNTKYQGQRIKIRMVSDKK